MSCLYKNNFKQGCTNSNHDKHINPGVSRTFIDDDRHEPHHAQASQMSSTSTSSSNKRGSWSKTARPGTSANFSSQMSGSLPNTRISNERKLEN